MIFKAGPFKDGTINIAEFLAIVHASAHCKQHQINLQNYSDSRNAIGWMRNKDTNTHNPRSDKNDKLFELLDRTVKWLHENDTQTRCCSGKMKIISAPGQGCTLEVIVPL